jgi:hypothetical protein
VDQFSAEGLVSSYNSLRDAAAKISQDLGLASDEFEAQFAPMSPSGGGFASGPQAHIDAMTSANTAAVQLRTLGGYVEGLIEAVVLDQQISMEQVQAAREAARQAPGFR